MAASLDLAAESLEDWDDSDGDETYDIRPTRRRPPARKKRKKGGHERTSLATPKSPSVPPPPSLQPLLDLLASKYASVDNEDATFDEVTGSLLAEYAKVRDELEERYERDDLGRPYSLLSESDEAKFIKIFDERSSRGPLSVAEAIISRKLKLQRHSRIHNLPRPLLRPKNFTAPLTALQTTTLTAPKTPECDPEVLDALYGIQSTPYQSSFLSRLNGFPFRPSPSSVVVATDWEVRTAWMDLMQDIRAHHALKCSSIRIEKDAESSSDKGEFVGVREEEPVAPITYVTLTAEHLPQVHDLLHRSFWSGIDVSDSLQHGPERATIVAMYKRLVIGCAILSSPAETYITYLAVRAGWENAQIATAMLFHLIDRNPNKDITLHVSTNNPAMLLYNRFGFKAEEFIVDFYEDYLDPQSRMSKNAFRLRLRR